MKRSVLLLAGLAMAFILSPSAMAQCQSCDLPCPGFFHCAPTWGEFLDCRSIGECNGCMGWYCEAPLASADEQPFTLKPFHRAYVLTAVTITNQKVAPVEPMPLHDTVLTALTMETSSRYRFGMPHTHSER